MKNRDLWTLAKIVEIFGRQKNRPKHLSAEENFSENKFAVRFAEGGSKQGGSGRGGSPHRSVRPKV